MMSLVWPNKTYNSRDQMKLLKVGSVFIIPALDTNKIAEYFLYEAFLSIIRNTNICLCGNESDW